MATRRRRNSRRKGMFPWWVKSIAVTVAGFMVWAMFGDKLMNIVKPLNPNKPPAEGDL